MNKKSLQPPQGEKNNSLKESHDNDQGVLNQANQNQEPTNTTLFLGSVVHWEIEGAAEEDNSCRNSGAGSNNRANSGDLRSNSTSQQPPPKIDSLCFIQEYYSHNNENDK
jgi:hypothetical protein